MDIHEYSRQIHAPSRKPDRYAPVYTHGIDEIWSLDSMNMAWADEELEDDDEPVRLKPGEKRAKKRISANDSKGPNQGHRWCFVAIDSFSKYLWVVPLKTDQPTAAQTLEAFKRCIQQSGRQPQKVWCDQGSEFKSVFKQWCAQQGIEIYHTFGQHKAAHAERVIRTIREIIWQHRFEPFQTREWVSFVPELLKLYNNRVHRSIGMTPAAASDPANEPAVFLTLYGHPEDSVEPRFEVGDWVRISLARDNPFRKGTDQNWSGEPFEIVRIKPGPAPRFYLRDLLGEDVEGAFYDSELQFISKTKPEEFLVEKVLKTRTRNGVQEEFVKWLGLPGKHNSWIRADDVTHDFGAPA